MSLPAGAKLGRYEIRSKIGEGGMGEVYRGRDTKLNREVAIKVLPTAFSENSERLRRFEQEAQAASALNHPNILIVYDVGTHVGAPYVVSELLEGETLRQRLGGSALGQRRAIDYALHIAQGIAAAHEKGIVHRDLKPDNIFITKDGRLKILDFGVAKLTQPEASHSQTEIPTRRVNTDPGVVIGTVGYMSPEQVRGKELVTVEGWRWAPDSRAIVYRDRKGDVSNLWQQPLDGATATRITNFNSEVIRYFSYSRDGKAYRHGARQRHTRCSADY